jgi:hypothetical protein
MKFIAMLILLLLTTSAFVPSRAALSVQQTTKVSELEKLEAQLKALDNSPNNVVVRESAGKITIVVEKTEKIQGSQVSASKNAGVVGSTEPKYTAEGVIEIDLTKIEVSDEYIDQKIAAMSASQNQNPGCSGVKLMQIGVTKNYEVQDDYLYDFGSFKMTAWRGFTYDRASIPRVFWAIIDKDSLSNVAPLFHDLLYRHAGELPQDRVSPYRKFSREQADEIFRFLMGRCGVDPVRREIAYYAVKCCAQSSWKKSF